MNDEIIDIKQKYSTNKEFMRSSITRPVMVKAMYEYTLEQANTALLIMGQTWTFNPELNLIPWNSAIDFAHVRR